VVAIFEAVGGRPSAITHVPVEALQARKRVATDSLQKSFAALILAYADGNPINMRETLKTFPVPPLSVKDYATRAVGRK
jgi:hypothetical protein